MKTRVLRALLAAVLVDGLAAFVGVLTWRWLVHAPGSQTELFCVLALISMAFTATLSRRIGVWVFLPPLLFWVWICGVVVSPFLVVGLAIQRSVDFARTWRAWRDSRRVWVVSA